LGKPNRKICFFFIKINRARALKLGASTSP
jgi:hypothetical protein